MMNLLSEHWGTIAGFASSIVAWIAGREMTKTQLKKQQAEASMSEMQSIRSNFETYQALLDDFKMRFNDALARSEDDLARVRTLNEELRRVIADQEKYIKRLKTKLEKYEKLEGQD